MKKAKLFMMLALLVMGVSNVWGQTTFTSDDENLLLAAFNTTLLASPVLQFAVAIGGIIAALAAYSSSLKKAREEKLTMFEEDMILIMEQILEKEGIEYGREE